MAFWSGETLEKRLRHYVKPFNRKLIDCASYHLTLGDEVYVSPTSETPNPKSTTKLYLPRDGSSFTIPAGQFAFLLTHEIVTVPSNAIAFISMRSRAKFKGLVNVSGFHVDPGYSGRLVFSVFNAGPGPIHMARGDDVFLIWYADLDCDSKYVRQEPGRMDISTDLINPIAGEIQSFEGLLSKIKDTEKKLGDRMASVERDHAVVKWATALLIGALITIAVKEWTDARPHLGSGGSHPQATSTPN